MGSFNGSVQDTIPQSREGWYQVCRLSGGGSANLTLSTLMDSTSSCIHSFKLSWMNDDIDMKVINSSGDGEYIPEFSLWTTQDVIIIEVNVKVIAELTISGDFFLLGGMGVGHPRSGLDIQEIDGPSGTVHKFSDYQVLTDKTQSDGIPDAPSDGVQYGRQDTEWTEIVHPPIPDEVLTQEDGDARYLKLAGGTMTGGINWNTGVRGNSPEDLTKLWRWYDGTEDFGMSVTTGRLNYVNTHQDNLHAFRTGGADRALITKRGVEIPTSHAVYIEGQTTDERYALKSEIPVIPPPTEAIDVYTKAESDAKYQALPYEIIPPPVDAYTKAESDAKYQPLPDNSLTQAVADTLYLPIDTVIPPAYVPPADAPNDGKQYGRQSLGWTEIIPTVAPPASSSATIGDVKSAILTADHTGWVKLDGRLVSTLTATQQTAAIGLGFTTNLPLADGCVLMQGGTLGAVSGSNSRTLTQANLPSVDLTTAAASGSSGPAGGHNHVFQSNINDQGIQNFNELLAGHGGDEPGSVYPAIKWRGSATIANTANNGTVINGYACDGAQDHTHTFGDHTHTVALGGSGTPLDITPKSFSVNTFVFLGPE